MADPVRGFGSGQQAVDRAIAFFGEGDNLRADEGQPMLAEPWERLLARCIDIAFVMVIFYVLVTLYLYPGAAPPPAYEGGPLEPPELTWLPPPADVGTLFAQGVFFGGLLLGYELATSVVLGATAGKRVFGLDIRDERQLHIRFRQLVVRTCPWALNLAFALLLFATTPTSILVMVPLVAAVVMLYRDDSRRTWYDRVARTTVVKPR